MGYTFDQTADLIRTLHEIGNAAMAESDYLNRGGCAFYASLVSKFLNANGIAHEGVVGVIHSCGRDIDLPRMTSRSINRARQRARSAAKLLELFGAFDPSIGVPPGDKPWLINEWGQNGVWFDHVGLRLTTPCGDKVIHDSTRTSFEEGPYSNIGYHGSDRFLTVEGSLTPEELYAVGLKRNGWNTSFKDHAEVIRAVRPIMLEYTLNRTGVSLADLRSLAC